MKGVDNLKKIQARDRQDYINALKEQSNEGRNVNIILP